MCPPPKPSPGAFVSQLKSRVAMLNKSFCISIFFKNSEVILLVWSNLLWQFCMYVLSFMYNCLLEYPDFLNYKSIPSLSSSSSMKSMSSSLQAWFEMITFLEKQKENLVWDDRPKEVGFVIEGLITDHQIARIHHPRLQLSCHLVVKQNVVIVG